MLPFSVKGKCSTKLVSVYMNDVIKHSMLHLGWRCIPMIKVSNNYLEVICQNCYSYYTLLSQLAYN